MQSFQCSGPRGSFFAASAIVAVLLPGTSSAQIPERFEDSFQGLSLESVDPLRSPKWDVYVHSRALDTWFSLDPMDAAHGLDGSPPPATHPNSSYEGAVYTAKQHLMTALNADAYGAVYLTPNALADFSAGECVIRFDVSTLRTSRRDWIDVWLTPLEDSMVFPLESALPDGQGNPRRGLQFRMETWNTVFGGQQVDWSHFQAFRYDGYAETQLPHNVMGYESEIVPSAMMRQTVELRISRTHVRIGMPDLGLWWVDTPVPDLGYGRAVVQFGHHSYNPMKDGAPGPIGHDTSLAGTANPSPNSWHWDNFVIEPANRFRIIPADRRYVVGSAPERVNFERPAPRDALLRFAAVGDAEVSFDGGPFQAATRQDGSRQAAGMHEDGFFSSYSMPIPEGTQTLDLRLTATGEWALHNHETMAKEFSIWSQAVPADIPGEQVPE